METYRIIRTFYLQKTTKTIRRQLTLAEAIAHCQDPEHASHTATSNHATVLTRRRGPWFDSYQPEKKKSQHGR